MNFKTILGALRIFGFIEGISFLCFLITMPLKYIWYIPTPNKIVGMLHGFLFIAFVILVFMTSIRVKWNFKQQTLAYLSSLIPFGTFVADAKLFAPTQLKLSKNSNFTENNLIDEIIK